MKTVVAAAVVVLAGCAATTPAQDEKTGAAMTHSTQAPVSQKPTDLQAQVWTLTQVEGPAQSWQAAALAKLQLNFVDGQSVVVKGLCNTLRGGYEVQDGALQVRALMTTMMACGDAGVMEAESQVKAALPQAQSWRLLSAQTLAIDFADGQRWLLQGQVKPEVLYGKPERVFLEVAAQKQACSHPLMADAQCLQVRSIQYSDQGLKQQVGEWENFYGRIEGFEHRPGQRNVLRLKRFTNPNPPADASRYIYVLDMVVESEVQH